MGSGLVRDEESARPTEAIPMRYLVLISVYWFGLSAVWGGYEQFGQKQVQLLVGDEFKGTAIAGLEMIGALIAMLVVPTFGAISDYTTSRFGRRKGYILSGTIFDVVFLTGLAFVAVPEPAAGTWDLQPLGSTTDMALYAVFFLALQFSSNVAQGPFQGFVPDLVAEPQVGRASGLVGAMRLAGLVGGALIMGVGAATNLWGQALVVIGLIELTLAVATFMFVPNGPPAKPREGRSWRAIATETWGLDVLHERSFVRMTSVRFLFLMGTGIFVNISLYYVEISLHQTDPTWRTIWWNTALGTIVVGAVTAAIVASRISDRTGRKPVIYAATLIASIGIVIIAVAPVPIFALPGVFLLGLGSGAYLAVDWALMTEIIPLISSGRYMGLANIANSISGAAGLVIAGPVIDIVTAAGGREIAQRVAVALGIVALAAAAALLRGVHPRRDPREGVEEGSAVP
jgi:MFS family permease